jgi:hypothetical protein
MCIIGNTNESAGKRIIIFLYTSNYIYIYIYYIIGKKV